MIGLLGIAALFAIAILLSENRRAIRPRVVLSAFALQAGVALLVIYVPLGKRILEATANGARKIVGYADVGTTFLFGELASDKFGFIIAFKVLPVIVFASSLIAILYYLGIMQVLVRVLGGAIRRLVGVTKIESFCAAANILVGMIEAPLVVRPYLATLSRSQFFAVLGGGLASVSGSVLLAYMSLGIDPNYLIAAAFMAAPGGLMMAKILIPDDPQDPSAVEPALEVHAFDQDSKPVNILEAATDGAATGLKIALNVAATLVAVVALFALANGMLESIGNLAGFQGLTFEWLLGYLFAPLMFLMGVPWHEATTAGSLVGQKTILNEFIAYIQFADIRDTLAPRTQAIITFALCGFANLSALAILMGGVGSLVPQRRAEIAQLGLKVVLVGTLSNLMSAALAGVILSF